MGVATKKNRRAFGVVGLCRACCSPRARRRTRRRDYPSRPITLLVPFVAGGSSDVVMRLVSKRVSERLKQTIVIDNRPGGAGNVAALAIKNAPKDGYTLMMGHTGTHAINATLYPDLKFDPVKDFSPITPLISFNNTLIVNEASTAKSVKELVALAKAKADGLTYASQGVGTGGHLLGVILAKQTGINLIHVPYRGVAPAVTDMVGGSRRSDVLVLCDRGAAYRKRASSACSRSPARSGIRNSRSCRRWRKPASPASRWSSGSACSAPAGMPAPTSSASST